MGKTVCTGLGGWSVSGSESYFCQTWQTARLNDIKRYCIHAETVLQDERNQQMKKSKVAAERLQMVQMAYYAPSVRGRNSGRGRGRGFSFNNREGSEACWKCGQMGHWARDCPVAMSEEWDGGQGVARPPPGNVSVNRPFGRRNQLSQRT